MSPLRHTASVCAVGAIVLTGCITGERPTLAEQAADGTPTGDAAVDAVLSRLEAIDGSVFTAEYDITNRFGEVSRTATVAQADDGRRSITIGDVRFLTGVTEPATCNLVSATCTATIDDADVSDLQVTHQFYGRSTASRLRIDAARNDAPAEPSTTEIAGQPATCVTVPVSGGSKEYCALDSGALARYDGPDVTIELTAYSSVTDQSLFTHPG